MVRASFERGAKLDRINKNVDRPAAALKQIGVLVSSESRQAFRRQEFGGTRWPSRGRVNVYGVIADLAEGREPLDRRFQSRPALIDTGRLRDSIAWRLAGNDSVVIGTGVRYANTHQLGGPIRSRTITEAMQEILARFLRSNQEHRQALGFLLAPSRVGSTLQGRARRRPFIGLTDRSRSTIERVVGVNIFEVRSAG